MTEGYHNIINGNDVTLFKLWIFAPIYLVAEALIFDNDFHNFFLCKIGRLVDISDPVFMDIALVFGSLLLFL